MGLKLHNHAREYESVRGWITQNKHNCNEAARLHISGEIVSRRSTGRLGDVRLDNLLKSVHHLVSR